MNATKILNPKTGRKITIQAWDINPREVLAKFASKEFSDARQLSWSLLADRSTTAKIDREMGGESASTNFGLSIFENGLDWTIGLAVIGFIRNCVSRKKMPKPFKVGVSRSGDVFIVGASGTVY